MLSDDDTLLRSTYGDSTHSCRSCEERLTDDSAIVEAERVHTLAVKYLLVGDLLCEGCASDLAADGAQAEREALAARYADTARRHPATVALCLRLPRLAALAAAGALLTVVDVAELNARADAAREARIVALEWEAEPDAPALPGELTWMPARRSGGSAARS